MMMLCVKYAWAHQLDTGLDATCVQRGCTMSVCHMNSKLSLTSVLLQILSGNATPVFIKTDYMFLGYV